MPKSKYADNPLSYQQGQRQQQRECYYADYQIYEPVRKGDDEGIDDDLSFSLEHRADGGLSVTGN